MEWAYGREGWEWLGSESKVSNGGEEEEIQKINMIRGSFLNAIL